MGNKSSTVDKDLTHAKLEKNGTTDKKSKRTRSFKKGKDETDSPLKNGNSKSKNGNEVVGSASSKTIFISPQHKPDNSGEKQLSRVILPEQDLEIKVYKRSRDGLDTLDTKSQRSRSLPRSKSAALRKSTDTLLSNEGRQRQQRYSSFQANGNASFNSRWSSIVGSESPADKDRPIGLEGVFFPTENVILSNKTTFEHSYVDCLVNQYYKSLPEVVQLSAIIIGYKRLILDGMKNGNLDEGVNISYEPINLWQYFNCTQENWIPADLITPQSSEWFLSAIPVNLLTGLVHLRNEGENETSTREQLNLCIEIVKCIAFEAAKELSRIYEYQIGVVPDFGSVQQLGRHAAERSVEYLRSGNRFVERDSLIEGVAYLPQDALNEDLGGFVSAIFGMERELQWDIRRIFCCCGLRLYPIERMTSMPESSCILTPPTFYTSRDCMPLIYGYRGLIYKKNIESGTNVTSQLDIDLFSDLLDYNVDDFHRDYIPLNEMKRMRTEINNNAANVSDILRKNYAVNANNYRYYENKTQTRYPSHNNNKVVGRISRQSTSTLVPENPQYRYSHSNSASTRSSILTNPNYNSLARSVDLGNHNDERHSVNSRNFNRDSLYNQSERPTSAMGGGRLSKYVQGHPNRIPLNDEDRNQNGNDQMKPNQNTMRRNIIKHPTHLTNGSNSQFHTRPTETSFEYEGNNDLVVTNYRNGFNRYHSFGQTNLENNLNRNYINGNGNYINPPMTNGVRHSQGNSFRLPPKPPTRTISCSQPQNNYRANLPYQSSLYNVSAQTSIRQPRQQQISPLVQQNVNLQHHTSVQNQQNPFPFQQQQQIGQQVTSPFIQPHQQQQLPQQKQPEEMQHHQQQPLQDHFHPPGSDQTSATDFLDFQSFLKLVEQQNANLKSFEDKISLNNQHQQQQQQQHQQTQQLLPPSNGVMSNV